MEKIESVNLRSPVRIALSNMKGGAGKSSTSLNLSAALVEMGLSVAVADADPQGSLCDWAAVRDESKQMPFSVVGAVRKTLHRDADDLQAARDVLIMDTPGRANAITLSAISAADIVLIPITTSAFDLWGAEQTLEKIAEAQALYPDIKVFTLINAVKAGTKIYKELKAAIAQLYKDSDKDLATSTMLETTIHHRTAVQQCSDGKTIFELRDKSAQREYHELALELLTKSGHLESLSLPLAN